MKIKIFKSKNGKYFIKREYDQNKYYMFEIDLNIMDVIVEGGNILLLPKRGFIPKKNGKKEIEQTDHYEKYNPENYVV